MAMHHPAHPGEVLKEYLPDNLSITDAANHLKVTRAALSRIINGHAGISAEMDLRLADALGTSPGFWSRMQNMIFGMLSNTINNTLSHFKKRLSALLTPKTWEWTHKRLQVTAVTEHYIKQREFKKVTPLK